ncbi:MAG: exo-beta-N-acetylmuramidase NamZ domain-containing protein [Tenuifilaceae bacterium]
MKLRTIYILFTSLLLGFSSIAQQEFIKVGADQTDQYLSFLAHKNIAIVANHSSTIGKTHLVDSLKSLKVKIKKIFCPEHGFRGEADAGEFIVNHTDKKTGLPIISLYGNHKKPTIKDLKGVDIVIFDMQDVGVRFYTYISTMHYVMEACAEQKITLIILDRPNPNGFYVDGPVLDTAHSSFVGLHPVPLVHGMTIGEYAQMINGEKWLKGGVQCNLKIIACKEYNHSVLYNLPTRPSPNLPNQTAIYLYPSLGLFEGTVISVGRGTDFPFQVFGHPLLPNNGFSFTPTEKIGASKNPPCKNELCYGIDLREFSTDYFKNNRSINLDWIIYAYKLYSDKDSFFNNYFNNLSGNSELKKQIKQGLDSEQIRKSWEKELDSFKQKRKKYLLYPDFE